MGRSSAWLPGGGRAISLAKTGADAPTVRASPTELRKMASLDNSEAYTHYIGSCIHLHKRARCICKLGGMRI
jgi:hypothetical protein